MNWEERYNIPPSLRGVEVRDHTGKICPPAPPPTYVYYEQPGVWPPYYQQQPVPQQPHGQHVNSTNGNYYVTNSSMPSSAPQYFNSPYCPPLATMQPQPTGMDYGQQNGMYDFQNDNSIAPQAPSSYRQEQEIGGGGYFDSVLYQDQHQFVAELQQENEQQWLADEATSTVIQPPFPTPSPEMYQAQAYDNYDINQYQQFQSSSLVPQQQTEEPGHNMMTFYSSASSELPVERNDTTSGIHDELGYSTVMTPISQSLEVSETNNENEPICTPQHPQQVAKMDHEEMNTYENLASTAGGPKVPPKTDRCLRNLDDTLKKTTDLHFLSPFLLPELQYIAKIAPMLDIITPLEERHPAVYELIFYLKVQNCFTTYFRLWITGDYPAEAPGALFDFFPEGVTVPAKREHVNSTLKLSIQSVPFHGFRVKGLLHAWLSLCKQYISLCQKMKLQQISSVKMKN